MTLLPSTTATSTRLPAWVSLLLIIALVSTSLAAPAVPAALAAPQAPAAGNALQFDGTNDYVTFGTSAGLTSLGAQVFTIETWFRKTGVGATTTTGTGGIATAIPLVTKGRGQSENSNVDMNYFLGIDTTGNVLAADFEECARTQTGCPATTSNATQGGQNYPVRGSTPIANNIWYHAAVTFDGRYWKLYLNGVLETTMTGADTGANRYPRWDSTQHAGIATAMNSTGVAEGYLQGVVDEVRVWNVVRTQAEIQANMNLELTSGTGLIGRWGLNEGSGAQANNSISGRPNGTLTNGPTWVANSIPPDVTPPAAPTGLAAVAGNAQVSLTWNANSEPDLAGYNVYRNTTSPVPTSGTPVNGAALVTSPNYNDTGVTNGTPYYYNVTAVDTSGNQSTASNEANATPQGPSTGSALDFGSTTAYVTFGQAPGLGVQTFTIEAWFRRDGAGTTADTGTSGVIAIPLVTKGRHENDNGTFDMNYFLGIRGADSVLVADFEECAPAQTGCPAGGTAGLNHPVAGATAIPANGMWHHAAATYDGTTWKLYLDGIQDGSLTLPASRLPRWDSIQHAALATALDSSTTEVPEGHFDGALDEVRIWNFPRMQAEIQATINSRLSTPQTGMIARWGMDEGSGTTVGSTAGTTINGTITGAGSTWIAARRST